MARGRTGGDPGRRVTVVFDTHMHTPLCKHAEGQPDAYIASAVRQGLPGICFTDHIPAPDGYDAENRMTLDQYPSYVGLVRQAAAGAPIPVGFGIEADYYAGCETFLRDWLPAQGFDMVLGSVHYIDEWPFDNPVSLPVWERANIHEAWAAYFRLLEKLARTRLFDVVGHLDLPKKFGHRPSDAEIRSMAAPALDRIAEARMCIELNTAGLRRPAREIFPSALILGMARERDIPICFGSDAHRPEDVGYAFPEALVAAREAGYTHYATFRQRHAASAPLPAAL